MRAEIIIRSDSSKEKFRPKLLKLNDKRKIIFGRGTSADVRFDDPNLSRMHCMIMQTESGYTISDLKSTNGTYVNGKKISDAKLSDGDLIKIGGVTLEYVIRDQSSDIEEQELAPDEMLDTAADSSEMRHEPRLDAASLADEDGISTETDAHAEKAKTEQPNATEKKEENIPAPAQAQKRIIRRCPNCRTRCSDYVEKCPKCGEELPKLDHVATGDESIKNKSKAEGIAALGVYAYDLRSYFNADTVRASIRIGTKYVWHEYPTYFVIAGLGLFAYYALRLLLHYAPSYLPINAPIIFVAILVGILLHTGLYSSIKDVIFNINFSFRRFFFFSRNHFLRYIAATLISYSLPLLLVAAYFKINALLPGIGLSFHISAYIFIAATFLTCSLGPVIAVLVGENPFDATISAAKFSIKHLHKILCLNFLLTAMSFIVAFVSVMAIFFAGLILKDYAFVPLSKYFHPILYLLPIPKNILSAAIFLGLIAQFATSWMLFYLSLIKDERELVRIRWTTRGPTPATKRSRALIVIILILTVALGWWHYAVVKPPEYLNAYLRMFIWY